MLVTTIATHCRIVKSDNGLKQMTSSFSSGPGETGGREDIKITELIDGERERTGGSGSSKEGGGLDDKKIIFSELGWLVVKEGEEPSGMRDNSRTEH